MTDVTLTEDVILVAANCTCGGLLHHPSPPPTRQLSRPHLTLSARALASPRSSDRLNVFGFLAGDELKAESPDGSVGGYGFADQVRALQWVQREIAAFGGNPARVTIQGESAGGASVTNHLVSPASRGLFAGAIIESGSPSDWSAQPYAISRTRLPQVAANVGCAGAGAALLACLRAVNATAMLAADHGLTQGFLQWSPAIDGVLILDDPRVLFAAGAIAPVPVLLGFNHDEGTLFNSAKTDINASEYVPALATIIGEALAEQVAAEYPLAEEESTWWAICSGACGRALTTPSPHAPCSRPAPRSPSNDPLLTPTPAATPLPRSAA